MVKISFLFLFFAYSALPCSNFSQKAWKKIQPIYQKILAHPFNIELSSGKLSQEKWSRYLEQDALYLVDYAKALKRLATQLPQGKESQEISQLAEDCLKEEKQVSITKNSLQLPATSHYTSFLLATASFKSTQELAAALLPCLWIYAELAQDLKKIARTDTSYKNWIERYSSERYQNRVRQFIQIIDKLASNSSQESCDQMLKTFTIAARLEWYFWEQAYRLAEWGP